MTETRWTPGPWKEVAIFAVCFPLGLLGGPLGGKWWLRGLLVGVVFVGFIGYQVITGKQLRAALRQARGEGA